MSKTYFLSAAAAAAADVADAVLTDAALLFSSSDFQHPLLFISSVMLIALCGIFNTLPLKIGTCKNKLNDNLNIVLLPR